MDRAELIELYRICWNAQSKYHHNANKLAILAMIPGNAGVWEQWEPDLLVYKEDAKKATKAWMEAAEGHSTEELVSIITEVLDNVKK